MPVQGDYLVVQAGRSPVEIEGEEDGKPVTFVFADEATADAVLPRRTLEALSVIGAWADLDWDEMVEALDAIRHNDPPSLPRVHL